MPPYVFYTIVQKSQKWPKTQIKGGGSCLNGVCAHNYYSWREMTTQPVILCPEPGSKSKWLPLNFGYHDIMCTPFQKKKKNSRA